MSFGNPQLRITPDCSPVLADREVERAVGLRHRLCVAVHPIDVVDTVLGCEAAGSRQLLGRVVDGVYRRSTSAHPRRYVPGAATEFDRSEASEIVRQQWERTVGDAPDPPGRFVLRPGSFSARHPVRSVHVPVPPVLSNVVGEDEVGRGIDHVEHDTEPSPAVRPDFVGLHGHRGSRLSTPRSWSRKVGAGRPSPRWRANHPWLPTHPTSQEHPS